MHALIKKLITQRISSQLYTFVAFGSALSFTCDAGVAREVKIADSAALIKKTYPNLKDRIEVLQIKPSDDAVATSFAELLEISESEQDKVFIATGEQKKSPDAKRFLNLPFLRSKLGEDKFGASLCKKFVDKFNVWEDPKKYPDFTKMLELMKKSEADLINIPFHERDQIFEKGFKEFEAILSTPVV